MTVARTATTLLFLVCICMSFTEAQREYVYTLNTTFKINVFIPYYTQYGMVRQWVNSVFLYLCFDAYIGLDGAGK